MPPIRLLVLSVLIVTVSTQPVFLLGAAFFQMGPEFGVGPVGLGVLTSLYFLTASVSSTPLGRWVQRVGWQRAMVVNTLSAAVILVSIAAFARSIWLFGAFLVIGAAVYGMSNPAANLALAEHTDPHRRATVFSIKHAGIPSSTLLAGFAVPALVVNAGWRWAFVTSAVIAVAVAWAVPRGTVEASQIPDDEDGGRPLSIRYLIGLGVATAFATWAAVGLGTFLVSGALDVGFSESAAGWLAFAGSASSIAGRIAAGAVTDHRRLSGFTGIALLTATGAVVFALLPLASGAVFGALVIVAFATGWAWPGLMTFTVVNANRRSAAASSAIPQAGVFVGAGIGPILLGTVIDRASFDAGWIVVSFALAVAAVSATTIRWRLKALDRV